MSRPTGLSLRGWSVPILCGIALLGVLAFHEAGATVLSSLGTSVGLLAALVAMLVLKAWPGHTATGVLSSMLLLSVFVGATVWWRRPASAVVLPVGLSRARVLGDLRALFLAVQAAWDRGDMASLQLLTLPGMLDELCTSRPDGEGLTERRATEILHLRAELLGFEALADVDLVSIDFSGLMREAVDRPPAPFREVWMVTRDRRDHAVWRLARHQALL